MYLGFSITYLISLSNRNMERDSPNIDDTHSGKRKGRRGTTLKELTKSRADDQKIPIEFDRQWRPIGPTKSKFISFVALQARSKPSITIKDWNQVDESVKDQIWNTIAVQYYTPINFCNYYIYSCY